MGFSGPALIVSGQPAPNTAPFARAWGFGLMKLRALALSKSIRANDALALQARRDAL